MRLAWPFNRRRASDEPPSDVDEQPHGVTDVTHRGLTFRPHFERQRMPDPGAQNYAYTTLALMPQTVCGTGFVPRAHIKPCQGGSFGQPLTVIRGLGGVQNGQLYTAPLYDRETGQRGGTVAAPYNNRVR